MDALRSLEFQPWCLAALAGLAAFLTLGWCLFRALERIEAVARETKEIALDHRRQFFAFAADQGWNDNMKLTQVFDADELEEMRKSR